MEQEEIIITEVIQDCPDIFEEPAITAENINENTWNLSCGHPIKDEIESSFQIEHVVIKQETTHPCEEPGIEYNKFDEDLHVNINTIKRVKENNDSDFNEYNNNDVKVRIKNEDIGIKHEDSVDGKRIQFSQVDVNNLAQIKTEELDYKSDENSEEGNRDISNFKGNEKQYFCSVCDYQTKRRGNLKVHRVTHDKTTAKLFRCYLCDFKTIYKSSLNGHVRIHMTNSELSCQYCGKTTFSKRLQLESHLLAIHKKESDVTRKIHKCPKCSFASVYKYSLKMHMVTHKEMNSDVSTFQCTHCEFTSFYKARFNEHLLKHNDKTTPPLFDCSTCNKSFRRKEYFYAHIVNHHCDSKELMAKVTYKIHECECCCFKTLVYSKLKKHITNCKYRK